jgi:hypothetical protein
LYPSEECGLAVLSGNPSTHELTGLIQIDKQAFIEKLVAHAHVEGFDVAVLNWFAWRNLMPVDAVIHRPAQHRGRGELGAMSGTIICGFGDQETPRSRVAKT